MPSTVPVPEWVKPLAGSFREWREVPTQIDSDNSDEERMDSVIWRPSKFAPQSQTRGEQDTLQMLQGLLKRLEGAIQNVERMVLVMPPTQGAGIARKEAPRKVQTGDWWPKNVASQGAFSLFGQRHGAGMRGHLLI